MSPEYKNVVFLNNCPATHNGAAHTAEAASLRRSSREAQEVTEASETKVKLIKERPHTFSRHGENSRCPSNLREDSSMPGGNPGLPEGRSVAKSSHSLLIITSRTLGFRCYFSGSQEELKLARDVTT